MVTEDVKISLPSSSVPSNVQQVVGIQSPHSSDLEEFRGIPYGIVTKRWESPKLADHLPSDTFDGSRHGYSILPAISGFVADAQKTQMPAAD